MALTDGRVEVGAVVELDGLAGGGRCRSKDGDALRLLLHALEAHADELVQFTGEHTHDVIADLGDGCGPAGTEIEPGDPAVRTTEGEAGGTVVIEDFVKGVRAIVGGGASAVGGTAQQRVAAASIGLVELDFRDVEVGVGGGDGLDPAEGLSGRNDHLVPANHGWGADGVEIDSGATVDGFLRVGEGDGVRGGIGDLGDAGGGVGGVGKRVAARVLAGARMIENRAVAADHALKGVDGSSGNHHVPEVANVVEALTVSGDGSEERGGLAKIGGRASRGKFEHASGREENPSGRPGSRHAPGQ